ncbi:MULTISPECIES: hypothetical protein [Oceanobacillus]|uniref:Uncharacterized protein n=2 Tax=Oceanobacillus TaxID=182709 RepID=A0A917XU31_9BACI|nr:MULTISPECIES: hypothetical protein [Oceanobacillus]GGN53915.1 hypothetical protein GCM10007971_10940 [Oceanobacillus indicireducens]
MSLGCMVLYHPLISSYTKSLLLRSVFNNQRIEIEVLDKKTTIIYLEGVEKCQVWQATMDFESSGIQTVYAFEHTKERALEEALKQFKTDKENLTQ